MPEVTMVTPKQFPFARTMRAGDGALFLNVGANRITELIDQGVLRAVKHNGATWLNYEDVLEYRTRQVGLAQKAKK